MITKIDKLTTPMSTYTLPEDDKESGKNLMFSNELKDTGEYLIKMGNTFLEWATAIEIVTFPQSQFKLDQNISDDDDVIYISTDGNEDDKMNKLKHIKKELALTTSSLLSSDNDVPDTDVTIPPFKHKWLIGKGEKFACSQCKMDFGTKSELHNHFASHTNITFKCNIC